jgi:hypothetical protein
LSGRLGTRPELRDGETLLAEFAPDRRSYLRDHAWMAALAMGAGMVILWAIGNPHVWTGAIGGLAAIALRGWYLADEEMAVRWFLTTQRLTGPGEREVALSDIAKLRSLGTAVQVVTRSGDKHLMKYQEDRDATLAQLRQAGVREDA